MLDFFLTGIHVKPSDAEEEINHLDESRTTVENHWAIGRSI